MNPLHPTHQDRRQAYLEALYRQSGRAKRGHPQHSLYTGLLAERAAELIAFDQRVLVGDPPTTEEGS